MKGSIVAIVTPMLENGEVDFDSFKKLLSFHEENNTDGIVLVGTTGESATLSANEREEIFKFAVAETEIPLMAGVGSSSTKEACRLVEIAAKSGISECLAVTPYYNKPSQTGLELHFTELANTKSMITLYNVPGRTGVDLLPTTTKKLIQNENIVGIKEAVNSIERLEELADLKRLQPEFNLLSGDDPTFVDFMKIGADGVISVAANVIPKQIKELSDLCLNGQYSVALDKNQSYTNLYELLFIEASPSPCKFLLEKMSLLKNNLRLPLHPLSESFRKKVYEAFISI